MSVRVVSFEAQVRQALESHLAGNLEDAASHYQERLRDKIGIQGPPRSTAGNPPHMDTTDLHESIEHQVDAASLTARISSDMPYAASLEIGGGNVAARPAWVPTLIEEADELGRIICR
jgi:hypothetical protein